MVSSWISTAISAKADVGLSATAVHRGEPPAAGSAFTGPLGGGSPVRRLDHILGNMLFPAIFSRNAQAACELLATGATVGGRIPETHDQLTSQEAQIARLARDGLSNQEVGAQLSLSTRTVEWHCARCSPSLASAPAGSYSRPWPTAAYRPIAAGSCSPVRAGDDGVMPSAASKRTCWSGRGRSPFHTTAAVAVSG